MCRIHQARHLCQISWSSEKQQQSYDGGPHAPPPSLTVQKKPMSNGVKSTLIFQILTYWSKTAWPCLCFDPFYCSECVWVYGLPLREFPNLCFAAKNSRFQLNCLYLGEEMVTVCLLSNCLSTEQIVLNLPWHVYQDETNVEQNENYLAEVRMLNSIMTVSMRNSSNTNTADFFLSNLCKGEMVHAQ